MDIRTQLSMVMHLDKCIGCHTCSVACKNLWTNRKGAEYMWWNNVETRPGLGYPKRWEDETRFAGGWELTADGVRLRVGSKPGILSRIFYNPNLPELKDYYEPYAFRFETLFEARSGNVQPVAMPYSKITGRDMEIKSGPNWDDDLGGSPEYAMGDPNLSGTDREIFTEFEKIFMTYLPRICNHCLNPACVAACPSGSLYKRGEDGIVLNDQDKCRAWRYCVSACPYKKMYYNWEAGKSEKCIFCYPKCENGEPSACSKSCVGRIRYIGVLLYDYDKLTGVLRAPREKLVEALKSCVLDPKDQDVRAEASKEGIPSDWLDAAAESPVYAFLKEFDLALPLHPEYRTFPMVFYVPSLSPVLRRADSTDMTPENMRIPVRYTASLFTAGNEELAADTVKKLLGIREYMKGRMSGDKDMKMAGMELTGWTGDRIQKAYSLTALANAGKRFVIPKGHFENGDAFEAQGLEGLGGHERR